MKKVENTPLRASGEFDILSTCSPGKGGAIFENRSLRRVESARACEVPGFRGDAEHKMFV